jgi:hypothetical protein
MILLISASQEAGIVGISHWHLAKEAVSVTNEFL